MRDCNAHHNNLSCIPLNLASVAHLLSSQSAGWLPSNAHAAAAHSANMLEVRDVPGKGRGVFAARTIRGGEVVLSEQPLLLYPQQDTAAAFCSYCLRAFNSLGER